MFAFYVNLSLRLLLGKRSPAPRTSRVPPGVQATEFRQQGLDSNASQGPL